MVVHKQNDRIYHILAIFLNGKQSPELKDALEFAGAAAEGMFKYMPPLPQVKDETHIVQSGQHRGRNHKTFGSMVMEGMFIGMYESAKGAHYYRRCVNAGRDEDFLRNEALHYTSLQAMERLHVPGYAENRLAFARRVAFPGLIPKIPLKVLAPISASCTVGYACDAHADSAVRGAAESIFWHAPPSMKLPRGHVWCFAICDACVLFDLSSRGCACYLPGKGVVHGTLPTGSEHYDHAGNGFALVTKARAVGERATEAYRRFRNA